MATTVSAFISGLASKYSHIYPNLDVLDWINEVELNVYSDIYKIYAIQSYAYQKDVSQFAMPTNATIDDIKNVYVKNTPYRKYDVRSNKVLKSYWYENNKLNIYPVPDTNDAEGVSSIKAVYQVQPTKKLIANIGTDVLLIPDKYSDIYTFYCISKICLFSKEFSEYKNWQAMFNNRVMEYQTWFEDNKPIEPESNIIADGPEYGNSSRNFDTEE